MKVRLPRCRHGIHSLRGKLTLANVALLAIGIVAATAVSVMGMRYYLLDQIDSELIKTRDSLGGSQITLREIDSLSMLGFVRDRLMPAQQESSDERSTETVFAVVDRRGEPIRILGFDPTDAQQGLAEATGDPRALAADSEPHDVTLDGSPYRATAARLGDGSYALLATPTDVLHQGVAKAVRLDLAIGSLLLALLACLTMFSVRRRMRPLEDMVETSSAIAEGDLTRRVPSSREATLEVEQLRVALNSMLHQVESAYRTREQSAAQLRSFVADASHELRTPLSAIRGYLQLYDKGMLSDPDDRKRAWARVLAETDRMGRLVDELLTLARLDQQPELRFRNVDLSRLVRDAADDLRVQQPGRPVEVSAEGSLLVRADESGLRQVLGNLVANVRTHTPAEVPVRLEVEREDGVVRLCVADEGPGLHADDAARVFDRFFRVGGGAGSGLGLAIVQGVVRAHGGEVAVRTAPGEGLAVTVSLPTRVSEGQ
ncbi:two-component system OmpR family sensor kinase [Streptomyces sp. SAI-144]|uniref:sensor histidine kinase n=1 Tax=unclassified Streptomyces TaxID=2593676 RepID=UPI0024747EAF|nr:MULTISPECIES: HAMP domain-containing sensor histidine kinase [unclassified Streptomyces]MDH6440534.1 two-component system OmpR family sensor kinase [Streptomyces sp. SAI-144]MDH6487834.1 two-component system OmpR family sensor kinase [Streptomyces sp. SAI-127]